MCPSDLLPPNTDCSLYFQKSFATFCCFSYLCNNDVAGRKEAVEQADTNQDFSSPGIAVSCARLVEMEKSYSLFFACSDQKDKSVCDL